MKLIKLAIIVALVILVLNYSGILNENASIKVDKAVENIKTKINELEYKDKALTDMTLKEISENISYDINHFKEDVITEDGLLLTGEGIKTTINPSRPRVLVSDVDATNLKAVESIEKLLFTLTKQEIKIPNSILEKGNFTVIVEKIDGEYNISFE